MTISYLRHFTVPRVMTVVVAAILIITSFIYDVIPFYCFVLSVAVLIILRYSEFSATLFITGGLIFATIYHILEIKHFSLLISIYGLIFVGFIVSLLTEENRFEIRGKPKFAFLLTLAIFFILLFQTYRSPAATYGMSKTLYFIINNMMFFLIPYLLFNRDEYIANIYKYGAILNVIFVLLSIVVLYKYGAGDRFDASGRRSMIIYARVLGLSLIFTVFALKNYSGILLKIIYSITIIISLFLMDLSGSRGPILLLFLSFLIYYLIFSKAKLNRKVLFLIFSLVIAYIAVVFLFPTIYDIFVQLRRDYSLLLRIYSYYRSAEYFILNPIMGWGTGSFMVLVNEWQKYPHNIFFEFAMETGVIGLGVFTIFCSYIFYKFISLGKRFYNAELFDLYGITFIVFLFGFLTAQKSLDISGNPLLWFAAGALTVFQKQIAYKTKPQENN